MARRKKPWSVRRTLRGLAKRYIAPDLQEQFMKDATGAAFTIHEKLCEMAAKGQAKCG